MKAWFYFFCISLSLILFSCGTESTTQTNDSDPNRSTTQLNDRDTSLNQSVNADEALNNPVESSSIFKPVYYSEDTDCNKTSSIHTNKGTEITIPANAFVDKNGKVVSGKVNIKFREFHTAGEIIASDIPMVYTNEKGEKIQFESAGMFEILAFKNNEELQIAPGKKIKVDLASNQKGAYNFYNFVDSEQNWVEQKTQLKEQPNKNKEAKIAEVEKAIKGLRKPLLPAAYNPEKGIFDIKLNPTLYPELEELNGIVWQYAGNDPKKDPANNKKFSSSTWEVITILPDSNYTEPIYNITLMDKDSNKFITSGRPVFQGKALTKASEKFKKNLAKYNKEIEDRLTEKSRAKQEYDFIRSMELSNLGIYNYDRQYKDPSNIQLLASFDFGKTIDLNKFPVSIFLIPSGENAVIKYTPDTYQNFAFNPSRANKLVAFLPGNNTMVFTRDDFNKIPYHVLANGESFTFILKNSNSKINNAKQLDELLATL